MLRWDNIRREDTILLIFVAGMGEKRPMMIIPGCVMASGAQSDNQLPYP